MTCEISLKELAHIRGELSRTIREQDDYAARYIELMRERPLMLVGGEMELLRRLARDAEFLASRHREALEAYRQAAMDHMDAAVG